MSKRLDETLGTVGYDNLINGLYPPAEPFSVVIRKGPLRRPTSAAPCWPCPKELPETAICNSRHGGRLHTRH